MSTLTKKPKTASVHVRVNADVKQDAETILNNLGMTLSEMFNLCLYQVRINRGLPFEVREKQPNAETLEAIRETDQILKEYEAGTRVPEIFDNARDFLNDILNEVDDE